MNEKLLSNVQCPICLETYQPPIRMLPCGHNFCESCLTALLSTTSQQENRSSNCPRCRNPLQIESTGVSLLPRCYDLEKIIEDLNEANKICPEHEPQRPSTSNSITEHENFAKYPIPSGLEEFDWYAGNIERENARSLLSDKPTGTFLVRISRNGGLAISLIYNMEIKHVKVFKKNGMYYIFPIYSFPSVPELIGFYQRYKLSWSNFALETCLTRSYRARPTSNTNHIELSILLLVPNTVPWHQASVTVSPIHKVSANVHCPNHQPPQPPSMRIKINGQEYEVLSKGKVLYDFEPQSPQELGLRCGQVVNIISKSNGDDGWWKGELNNKVGCFPAKFVQDMGI